MPEAAVAVPTAARALRLPPSTQRRNVTATSAALTGAVAEAITSAREAGLSYVTDERAGLRRVRAGKGFRYIDPEGRTVRDAVTLARIRKLAIPPAWTDVWVCPLPNGHLQATGHDVRGRKQYRYHERWRTVRDENKFGRVVEFARALPAIRRKVALDLSLPGMPREKVIAAVVRLLETTFIRIGNERYAKENGSYGLTTMRNRHVRVRGERIHFDFKGKSGRQHRIELADARLAGVIRRCQDLPGYELFQYVDAEGEVRSIGSADVNDYLKAVSGQDYTAKDFRTWAGTVLAVLALRGAEPPRSATHARKVLTQAVAQVAAALGNTAAVCRKSYIHPRVPELFMEGVGQAELSASFRDAAAVPAGRRRAIEKAVIRLLTGRARRGGTNGTNGAKHAVAPARNGRALRRAGSAARTRSASEDARTSAGQTRRRIAVGRTVTRVAGREPAVSARAKSPTRH